MKLFSLTEFSTKAAEAFKRFPFTLVWVILSAAILVVFVEKDFDSIFEENLNITLLSILGVSWLIGTQFYIEQFKKKRLWWIKVIVISLLIAFYFTLPEYDPDNHNTDTTSYIRWLLFFIAGHLALLFAPFITIWHPKAYWNYVGNMMTALARSALFSGVLYLGLVLAMLAVQYLFDIDIEELRYFQLFITCVGIVNTWVYLSDFPKEIQHNIHITFYKATEVFVMFILIPLAILYIIILYAYAFKIVLQWELPKGWVSYLVTALAGLLFLIQLIIHPMRISHESRIIRKFNPLAYWLLLPLLILLYTAIYKRISDYGITEARYFLILIAVFITGASLYLLFSRKQQLRYLPMALAVFAIFGSFGFWGAFSMSTNSQLAQFEEVYTAFAKADSTTISRKNEDRFVSITRYLGERKELARTSKFLGYNPESAFPNESHWNIGHKILDTMGLRISRYNTSKDYLSYGQIEAPLIDVKKFDYFTEVNLYIGNSENQNQQARYSVFLQREGEGILITGAQGEVIRIPLIPYLNSLPKNNNSYMQLDTETLSLTGENDKILVKVYFTHIDIKKKNEIYKLNNCNAYILLKIKE